MRLHVTPWFKSQPITMKIATTKFLLLYLLIAFAHRSNGQEIPSNRVLSNGDLSRFLKEEVKASLVEKGEISNTKLAEYFRQKFAERFFYDYQSLDERLALYNRLYNNQKFARK